MCRRHRIAPAACLAVILLSCYIGKPARADFPEAAQLPFHSELPDPLVTFNGERVTSRDQWLKQRRPELKTLFQHYMYGYFPDAPKVTATLERIDRQ